MFCPTCRGEFRKGFTRCEECNVDLVETLPPPEETREEDLVPALETTDVLLVSATRSALENEGIPFVIQGEEAQGLLPLDAVVLVPRDRLAEAQAVIEKLEEPPDDSSSG